MVDPSNQSREVAALRTIVDRLEQTVRQMEQERERAIARRRRRLLIIGASLSLLFHIALLIYLGMVGRGGAGGGGDGSATFQLAVLNQEELSELDQSGFDELAPELTDLNPPSAEAIELEAISPAVGITGAASGSVPTLGASGEGFGGGPGSGAGGNAGGGLGLGGGGGAAASFFGIGAKGTRFAYIVDVSGSMGENRKIDVARGELGRSIQALPDYSHFYVLLFSSSFFQPPMQKGWTKARKPNVRQLVNWLDQIDPGGGTEPRSSFFQVFSLDVRPDVIFFLTDGQFSDVTPEEVASLNAQGKKAVINTIQFGDPGGEEVLKQIAKQSGGVYRFVGTGGL